VKRIDNFLKWFGLSSIAITLVYLPFRFYLFPNSFEALAAIVGILCIFGAPCAVVGLLQYDSTRLLYKALSISKYTGLLCWIFAVLLIDTWSEHYIGSAFAVASLVAWTISVFCAVLGMRSAKRG